MYTTSKLREIELAFIANHKYVCMTVHFDNLSFYVCDKENVITEDSIDKFLCKKSDRLEIHTTSRDCYFHMFLDREENSFTLKLGSASDWGNFGIDIKIHEDAVIEMLNVFKGSLKYSKTKDIEDLNKSNEGLEIVYGDENFYIYYDNRNDDCKKLKAAVREEKTFEVDGILYLAHRMGPKSAIFCVNNILP